MLLTLEVLYKLSLLLQIVVVSFKFAANKSAELIKNHSKGIGQIGQALSRAHDLLPV